VERHESFVGACAEAAERATLGLLERRGVSLGDFDLLVPAPAPEGFADAFLARPGLQGARAARPPAGVSFGHTAAAACAMAEALESSRDRGAASLLVVAAGAGLTVALLWYRARARAGHGQGSDRC
jgi:3-oxoacyl-[acyl-carrier-protein] synthase III